MFKYCPIKPQKKPDCLTQKAGIDKIDKNRRRHTVGLVSPQIDIYGRTQAPSYSFHQSVYPVDKTDTGQLAQRQASEARDAPQTQTRERYHCYEHRRRSAFRHC